jgi:predicted Zn finger-like uncharacterized protein
MLITCPSCATSYDVRPDILGASGRSVRCARCERVWHADLPQAQKLLQAADAIGVPAAESGPAGENWAAHAPPESDEGAAEEPLAPGRASDPGQAWPFPDAVAESGPEAGDAALAGPADLPEAPPLAPIDLDDSPPAVADAAGVVDDAPSDQPLLAPAFAEPGPAESKDVESFAARRARRLAQRRRLRWPLSRLQSAILVLLVVNAVLVGWRSDVVRLLPQTASFFSLIGLPVNLRGLMFDGIEIVREQHEGVPVLVVEGNIVNVARRSVEVPRLKLAVRNASGQEIYTWTAVPPRSVLPSGEAVAFRSRLASPPPEGREVLVRFLNRRDVVAGVR